MTLPNLFPSIGIKGVPFHADGDEVAAATKAKVTMISCDGHLVPVGTDGRRVFAKILAQAQHVGTYEGNPIPPSDHNVNSYIDNLKVQGLSDAQAVELANAKYGENARLYAI